MKYSVVIPCYYSQDTISSVIEQLAEALEGLDYEIILVNDGSLDHTFDVIRDLVVHNHNIKGINLAYNTGQHNATMAGLRYVSGDRVLVCADDGQSPLEVIPDMISALDQGYDLVSLVYTDRGQRGTVRKLGSILAAAMSRWLLEKPSNVQFSFDFMAKRFVIDEMVRYEGPYVNLEGLVFRSTHSIKNIEASQHERVQGKSGYTFGKLIKLWMNGFTAFSIKPLRIASAFGCIFAVGGIVLMLFFLIRRLMGIPIAAGWTSTIVILLLGFGIVMLLLGMIGEYLGRIYMSLNGAPQYVVKEVAENKEQ